MNVDQSTSILGVVPALVDRFVAGNSGQVNLKIPALFFASFSVSTIWLLWRLVLQLGETRRVAFLASTGLALCSSFLYYSRHLLPYDTAMAIGFLALVVGLPRPPRPAARPTAPCPASPRG